MIALIFFLLAAEVALETEAATAEVPDCCRPPSRFSLAVEEPPAAAELTVAPSEAGAVVKIGAEVFAEYRVNGGGRPVVWPLYGPGGHEMTRSWPLGPRRENEETDHPHHRSLWLAHGDVKGHDFWVDSGSEVINHRAFSRLEAAGGVAVIETENDWRAAGEVVLTDRRTLAFGLVDPVSADSPRYVDFTAELIASRGPVTLGDTKEGTFAVRVPGAMKVSAGLGGRVRNSLGETDGAAWGRPAEWVDYSGPLTLKASGPRGGIAIFAHPDAFRPAQRWHVREYGLFAANPFGERDFAEGEGLQGAVTIEQGESLVLRYRVVLYAGDANVREIASWRPPGASPAGEAHEGDEGVAATR